MTRFVNVVEDTLLDNIKDYICRMLEAAKHAKECGNNEFVKECSHRSFGLYHFAVNYLFNWDSDFSNWWEEKEKEFDKLIEEDNYNEI